MATLPDDVFEVDLGATRVGALRRRGDHASFLLDPAYRENAQRPLLGLLFEEDLDATHAAKLRLPPWFSNLLPEGPLRAWIAEERDVSPDREMELLAHVGHDLAGAVRVSPAEAGGRRGRVGAKVGGRSSRLSPIASPRWRFSLAGIGLKFSMLAKDDRFTAPASGAGGDWIVKLPDAVYPHVPDNEYAIMRLGAASGLDVPEVRLVHRENIEDVPTQVWPHGEEWAFAVRRFDRDAERRLVHIEDLAQVRGLYPDDKYTGSFETVAALVYRGHDLPALRELARRLAFNILVANGDAHLKNWSLIYRDPRVPTLSPAYDLVHTAFLADSVARTIAERRKSLLRAG